MEKGADVQLLFFSPSIWSEIDAVVAKNLNPIYTVLNNKKQNCQ